MSEEQQEQQFVEVLWEDGSILKCEIYDVIDFENKTYALLIPLGEEENDDTEVLVMELVEDDEENAHFQAIEDEDEFNRVCEYVQIMEDEDSEYDFEDEDE